MATSNFSIRTINNIVKDVFTNDKPLNLQFTLFELKDESTIDIGAMCYRKFRIKNRKFEENNSVRETDLNTYDPKRLGFIENLIDELRLKNNLRASSKRNLILKIMRFVSWLGEQDTDYNFESSSDVKSAYHDYTKWLISRTRLKDKQAHKISNNSASAEQKAARLACSLITGLSVKEIEYWATPLRHNDRESFHGTLTDNPVVDEDRLKTYSALCDFINQTWELWVNQSKQQIVVNEKTVFTQEDLNSVIKRDSLYRRTLVAALLSFIGASGANLEIATNSTLDNFTYGQGSKNNRLSGLKSRAGRKFVQPEFAAKYLAIWKKWLAIRDKWLATEETASDYAFPCKDGTATIRQFAPGLTDRSKPVAKFFMNTYEIKWLTARDWRSFKSKLLGRASHNDLFVAASMQGHSTATALKHYTNRNLADAAKEISSALDAVYDSAVARSRSLLKIPVKLVVEKNQLKETLIGSCESETVLLPKRAPGFTEFAPTPNCSVKETCLFCEQYAAHADETDIRKLLSFEFLVNELASQMPQEEWSSRWAVYVHRVSEILTEMKNAQPRLDYVIETISEEIADGELDSYWLEYYKTLSYFGVLSA